jgi:transcriptional regulator with XRE-family HTH domain
MTVPRQTWETDLLRATAIEPLRKAKGLTRAELAADVGTSEATVKRIETGDTRIDATLLFRILARLGKRLRIGDHEEDGAKGGAGE